MSRPTKLFATILSATTMLTSVWAMQTYADGRPSGTQSTEERDATSQVVAGQPTATGPAVAIPAVAPMALAQTTRWLSDGYGYYLEKNATNLSLKEVSTV
jgi:hypothetical protein